MIYDNSGRSMIEMMGVLVIIGALSTGGIAGYTKALHQNKVKTAVEQISVISGHLSTIGANGGQYSGMSNKTATKLKAVLPEMRVDPSSTTNFSLKNPFGGNVTISSAKLLSGGGGDQAYTIKYDGLDNKACIEIATHDWGNAKGSSFIGITAGKTIDENGMYLKCTGYKASGNKVIGCTNGSTVGVPIPVSEAAVACSDCANSCSVMLKYF